MIKSFTNSKKVIFCKKCVISNQRPNSSVEFKSKSTDKKTGIKFDKNGVCSACTYNEIKNKINWKDREKKLIKLLDKFRRKSGYDVVVPGSGGKDILSRLKIMVLTIISEYFGVSKYQGQILVFWMR